MPLRRSGRTLSLDGECGVEEALFLAEHLAGPGALTVDLAGCTHLHTALVQALAAGAPRRIVPPQEEFLARWLMPIFASATRPTPARAPRRPRAKAALVSA
jgi:electron transfer flavoprotein alpha/beta subunit